MFIRRTTIKSRESGEPYYTYRLVESVRMGQTVRQQTVLNLGRQFEVPRAQWGPLAQRIEALIQGQLDLIADGLEPQWEAMAQDYAARIVSRRNAGQAGDCGWSRGWMSFARAVSGPNMWPWRRCGAWVWTSSLPSWD